MEVNAETEMFGGLLPSEYRVVVQGITGHQGRFHTRSMLDYGTNIVAGVTPGKGGSNIYDIPVYDYVADAVDKHSANTSIIFVPAPFALDACFEAIDAGIKTLVIITEHIPVHDTIKIIEYATRNNVKIIGPNTPGITIPNKKIKVGIMPNAIFRDGNVGVVSRSGTLTYEIVDAMSSASIGQSICIGLGGDPITGLSFIDLLKILAEDESTEKIVLVGEIGGTAEEEAAEFIKVSKIKKPIVAYIAGRTAPPGKRMGHAGAIVERGRGTAESKIKAFETVGVRVAVTPQAIPKLLAEL